MSNRPVVRFFKDPGKDGPKIDFSDRSAEIGAIWKKDSKAGGVFYTGTILGEKVVGFPVKQDGGGGGDSGSKPAAASAPADSGKAPWE